MGAGDADEIPSSPDKNGEVIITEVEIDELEGIGPTTKAKLNDIGITTVLDLAAKSPSEVADAVGSDLSRAT